MLSRAESVNESTDWDGWHLTTDESNSFTRPKPTIFKTQNQWPCISMPYVKEMICTTAWYTEKGADFSVLGG